MNKFINLLGFLLIINLLIFCNLLVNQYNHKDLLSISYAKTAIHNNDNYNLILSILKDTNKNNLIKYADYIELNIVESIPNDTENKIAFTLSLPEQVSFIAIYSKISDTNYKFEYLVDDLACINDFYFYKNFLVVDQTDTNSSNEFSKREFFEVFIKGDTILKSIFQQNIYSEKIFKNNNTTCKEVEKASIDYLSGNIPKILCIITTITYNVNSSSLNFENKLEKISEITRKEIYSWNDSQDKFILSKEEIIR
ncbi:hypothetical protein [Romboutsia sp.]|uniref:hypothetical protein n=1 Tax=Romboutsia sp. TaxID=1965302 RepID=UPI002D0B8C55|nr:hypothetical protein [Romboutsia sp.]HSQ88191.1 hypothetical protein [Romboutsia sp.]